MNCGSSADNSPWRTKKSISTRLQLYLNSLVSRTVSNTRRTGHSSKECTSPSFARGVKSSGNSRSKHVMRSGLSCGPDWLR